MSERIEYGVICDRTGVGLGMTLIATHGDLDRAFATARRYDEQCVIQHPHEHQVKKRIVRVTEWSSPIWSPEHDGGCNDRCTPNSHYMATR